MSGDSPDRFDNVIHVATVGEEQGLRHADRRLADLLVAFKFLEAIAVRLQPFRGEQTSESTRIDRLVDQPVVILFVITAAAGDAFGAESLYEFAAR